MYAEWQTWETQIDAFPLDSRNYGLRAQTYRRIISSGFDDNLDGWKINVSTDTAIFNRNLPKSQLKLHYFGLFPGKNGERFVMGITAVTSEQSGCYLRLE